MNVAICVGDTEMPGQKLRQAFFFFFQLAARAKPSMWTICRCSTNPHPQQRLPRAVLLDRAPLVSLPVCGRRAGGREKTGKKIERERETEREKKRHAPPTWMALAARRPANRSQHAPIAAGSSATSAHSSFRARLHQYGIHWNQADVFTEYAMCESVLF